MPRCTFSHRRTISYQCRKVEKPKGTLVLIHGLQQSGDAIFSLLRPYLPDDWNIFAPDGPFTLISRSDQGVQIHYTWYVFDPVKNHYLVDMSDGCTYLEQFLLAQNLSEDPLVIVGYSQGGYLAPIAAKSIASVSQVIGINCRFRDEILNTPLPFRLDAIHGTNDPLVEPKRARQCHQSIMQSGNRGQFWAIEGEGHRLTPKIGAQLEQIIGLA